MCVKEWQETSVPCAARVNTDGKANTEGNYTLKFNGLSETFSAQRSPYEAAKHLARSAHGMPCCSSVSSRHAV